MTVEIVQYLCPDYKYELKCPYPMTPQFIVLHNTGDSASAMNEISYMIRNNNFTSYHFAVDDERAVQGIPLDRNTWHCGDGEYGKGNRGGISIEICYSTLGGKTYEKAEENGILLTAILLKKYGWGVDKVFKHQDFNGKFCPHRILSEGRWEDVKRRIQVKLNELNETEHISNNSVVGLRVRIIDQATNFIGGKVIDDSVKGIPYTISQEGNCRVFLKELNEWVHWGDIEIHDPKYPLNGQICYIIRNATHFKGGQPIAQEYKNRPYTIDDEGRYLLHLKEIDKWVLYGDVTFRNENKHIEQVAQEVINGLWGNGAERKTRLLECGYDYQQVQNLVNEMLNR